MHKDDLKVMKKLKGATLYVVRLGKCAKTHEYEPRTSFPC